MTYEYSYNGAGVAAGDINNDGLTDLYFSGNSVLNKLFVNEGEWKFKDITVESKTQGRSDWKTGVTMVDVNGDNWLDIYVCYSGNAQGEGYNLPIIKDHPKRANELYINNRCKPGGIPTFTEKAKEYGLDALGTFSTQAYFFDYDLDNDLDMFLLNHANMFYAAFFNTKRLRNLRHPYFGNKLYRNDGNRYTEVSNTAGFHGSGLNFGLSASISDLNFDSWPDIYVTNDYEEQDFCYINNRDGTFREVSHKLFQHLSKFGMGSDIADINNDGLQDIIVLDMLPEDNHRQKLLKGPDEYDRYSIAVDSGYHHQYMRNTLQVNRGFNTDSLPRFSEIGQLAGISNTDWSWAPLIADFDNDGLKDIFIANGYLRDYNNLDFIKYTSTVYSETKSRKDVDHLKLIQQLPSTSISNYLFSNTNGFQFQNVAESWGLSQKVVSNGSVYADLDNDGDYDLITNNLNDKASVFRNNQDAIQKNNFIKIKLVGSLKNTQALGAKVWIKTKEKSLFQEAYFARGYLSNVEPVLTIGLGKVDLIDEIKVQWNDKTESLLKGVKPNRIITIEQVQGKSKRSTTPSPNQILLADVTQESLLKFKHEENRFIDFKGQKLLMQQLSRLGGQLSKADVDKDGNDDVFFGGASEQSGRLYFGMDKGSFRPAANQPWKLDSICEDTGSVFFDADNDGDKDLYVVSGGSEFKSNSQHYQDRLYINDGQGGFVAGATDALPQETTSGSCVASADYDKDGDLDLFVGGRHVPNNYGLIPRSYILENNTEGTSIKFSDHTSQVNKSLVSIGMVTGALWTDYNGDSWPDLVVVGEWMPIRIFENNNGKLEEKEFDALNKSNGWWCSISQEDVDDDGDNDLLVGNAGNNLQFHPTKEKPIQLFSGDFNNDSMMDPILCHYIQGESYPFASRDELLDQVNTLRKKFIKYEDYADARIDDIIGTDQLKKAYKFYAYTLESVWLENMDGADFQLHVLPPLAQLSAVNDFVFHDFDLDGKKDLLAAGNFFPYKPQLGRNDASTGTLLRYSSHQLVTVNGFESKFWLTGDIRDIALVKFNSGVRRIIASRNNDSVSVYSVKR
jgi:hypothetical protein